MGFFTDIASLAGGVASAFGNGASGNGRPAAGLVDSLCAQLGWPIDGRDGNRIYLDFNDSLVGRRRVAVLHGDGQIYPFVVHSHAVLPAKRVPAEVAFWLLVRNKESSTLGAWQLHVGDDGGALFCLVYAALSAGLDAATFKCLCESLVKEAHEFDVKMDKAGLLRGN